jgi:hypothetical protein
MEKNIKPFITSRNRLDILAQLAYEHTGRVNAIVSETVARGMNVHVGKLDGKAGASDGGASGFWDKKDGKEGKDKEKDGKESKEGKEGKESKDGKDSKDGKEGKEGKESKDGKETKEGKDGGKDGKDNKDDSKDGSKDGKDKDDKDGTDGAKFGDDGDNYFRYGDDVVLPYASFETIGEIFNIRLTALLNAPIF